MYDLNSIDGKTKYVLAHSFVEKRTKKQCRALFKQIKDTCYKQIIERYKKEKSKPIKKRKLVTFVSDGFENYKDGATYYFNYVAKIIFDVPIACKKFGLKHNNNAIEKYNQDIKDQIKTKRHFGSFEGAEEFLNLRHVVKNFINPHQSLKGRTPAEEAGINLMLGKNKLKNLITYRANLQMTKS
jgi:transposase-like protein